MLELSGEPWRVRLNAEIREGESGDIFPDDFLVFPGDFRVSFGRMSQRIPSMRPAPQLLKTRGLIDPSPLSLAVSPENSGVSWLLDLAGACRLVLQ
jgi:hypothetical protein